MKVILFANTAWYLYNFRLNLAEALRQQGHDVVLVSPPDDRYPALLQAAGFRWVPFSLQRRGTNIFAEAWAVLRLTAFFRRERPDLVHNFTIKSVLYGSAAAHLTGVQRIVNAVPGLGYVFTAQGPKAALVRGLAKTFYRLVLKNTRVIFQNPEDLNSFLQAKLVQRQQTVVIRGSGVDVERFTPTPEPGGTPLVVLAARMLWDKGIPEFVEAAALLKAEGVPARFALVGRTDPGNPTSVPDETLESWQRDGKVEWWGWRDDMAAVYREAHIVCLPTRYGEGLPKSLLEAAASGRAIIASDWPGCREVVRHQFNGLLVPPGNAGALAASLRQLIEQPALRAEMGSNGRGIVVAEFSAERTVAETIRVYNETGVSPTMVKI